ncbi:kinase non-catalytic C-lobe domain-containing protein 1 isoform X4 [Erinaceus europaeus]|uniref:Kinase non-catalytic C-lobe domain-containing protein 1 isoform X4 n=1 Tax=Erinaceus europaeus TaxID=9365 RepID=A0ABM3VRR5_ERIEU|nr:kinase non-catalytic C-lobe domain-containing protein 1 isoform X4 [Erinaceus europaeus]
MESPRFREDGEDLDFYFQPLPPLAEDEENVSLADILSLRARGLSEQEAWAVGLECGLSLHKVAHAGLFQTLCITPDTLAFDTSGHVSFMEQLSDDPEGAFVPPEFDDTGNTFEAHVYSLGATLKAALDFMGEPEPEPEPRLSHELEALLDRMQALDPRERPDLQSVIVLCEQKLWPVSSCRLCRSLSAVGRRVLSIESFGAFPDISENTWTGRLAPRTVGTRRRPPDPADAGDPQTPSREDPGQPRALKPLFSAPLRNGQSLSLQRLGSLVLGPQPGCPGRSSLRKVRTLSWLLPEAPEAGPTEASPEGRHGHSSTRPQPEPWQGKSGASVQAALEEKVTPAAQHPPKARSAAQSAGAPEGALDSAEDPGSLTEQAVSLQTLLSTLGRPLKEYELWALSHACLSALWTQRQHPAYLCPDSVLVAKDGAVFFRPPPANGAHNAFFLAPEVAEQKLVTEKASVYCMAAVLWTAARFCVPQGQKLALPHRLKALLLDMARRSPRERPAPAEAVKVCGAYLLQRGMDSRKVLAHLLTATCKVDHQEETISLQTSLSPEDPRVAPAHLPSSGFMPIRGDTRLVPCQEPMPGQGATELPLALNSAATDFRPILLSRDIGVAREDLADSPEEHGDWQDEQSKGQWVRGAAPDLESPQLEAASPGQELELRALAPGLPTSSSPPSMAHTPLEHQQEAQPPIAAPHHTLGPQYPEPTASTHAHRPPPAGPPRVTDPPSPGQEPRGPHPASANAESLGDPPHGEQDGQAPSGPPQQPRPAREPSGVDTPAPRGPAGPSLQEAMSLIQEHFASDGYPDNGLETLIMGEYIFGLRDLTFSTFCGAVSEKFCDLFWGEKLLLSLFSVVNGHRTFEEPPSQPGPGCTLSSTRTPQLGEGTEQLPAACRDQAPCPPSAPAPVDGLSRGNFEVGFRSQRPVSVQDTRPALHGEAHPEGSADAGAQPAPPGEARPAAAWSCGPGWGSAFYEADCFGPDVQKYLQDLGVHGATQGAPTSAHSMGLEQQLLMEKRNFRKTLKFYQKLLQKEKRNKGSEVKSMVTRLKGQLEEMRSRVRFLGLVRRYLQVVYAEQWGLEPSMLPVIVHLAGAPCDSLALSPLDESSSLIFYNVSKQVCGGQQSRARVLQAGTPLGLMAYLYSRHP